MSDLLQLPPLREVVDKYGLAPKKALGQNFLFDLNLTGRIAREAGPLENHNVIEIGPGPGGLTRSLLAEGANEVIAIERDSRCLAALEAVSKASAGRLQVVEEDALKVDFDALSRQFSEPGLPIRIIANLPYNVATPLFTGWVLNGAWPPFYKSLTLMFQKEVAQRICAKAGDKAYGRLGVISGWRLNTTIAFDVDARNFTPPPKVTSAVLHATPKEQPLACVPAKLELVTKHAFGQRRKMLRASLKPLGGEKLLASADIDPTRRAENLGVEEFVALANLI